MVFCYKPELMRLETAVIPSGEATEVWAAIRTLLGDLGAEEKFGLAPKGPLERLISAELQKMGKGKGKGKGKDKDKGEDKR